MKQDACTMMPQTQDARTLAVDAVLFDLDGTLVDSVADLYLGVCGMLRDLGRPEIPVEDVRAYVGRGMHNLVKRVLAGSTPLKIRRRRRSTRWTASVAITPKPTASMRPVIPASSKACRCSRRRASRWR